MSLIHDYDQLRATFDAVYASLKWPIFNLDIKVEEEIHTYTARYARVSKVRAEALKRFAVFQVFPLGDNLFDDLYIAAQIEGEEYALQDPWAARWDSAYLNKPSSRDITKRTISQLRTLAGFLNAQLLLQGYRVCAGNYLEQSGPSAMDDAGEYKSVMQSERKSWHFPVEEEFWEAGLLKKDDVRLKET
jgi:hypothetical protein